MAGTSAPLPHLATPHFREVGQHREKAMKYTECMIAWNRETDQIAVGPWPDRTGWSRGYRMTVGASFLSVGAMTPTERDAQLLCDFHTVVVRDRVPVEAAHVAFLAIDEYRRLIAPDCPGADP